MSVDRDGGGPMSGSASGHRAARTAPMTEREQRWLIWLEVLAANITTREDRA